MPIVTAAGYPVLTSPSVEAAPTPGAPYQQIQSSPDAFGAGVGRAQQQLGDTFEKASNQFEAVALEQQRLTNQIAADNADNYTMDQVQNILHGDPNKPGDVGYLGLKGEEAVNQRQPTIKAINDLLDRTRSTLSNPRQQIQFDQQTRRMRNYWVGSIGQHYDTQLNLAAAASVAGSIKLAEQQQASTAATQDEVGFGLGIQREMEGVQKQAKNLGYGQEWVDAKFGEIRAKGTSQWVQSMAVKDPLGADKYLEANQKELAFMPGEYQRLKGQIYNHAAAQQAQEDVYGVPPGQKRTNPAKIQGLPGLIRGGAVQQRVSELGIDRTLDMIEQYESGGKNIPNYRFDATHTAGGFFQITNSTWRQYAAEAGVDLAQYPTAMSAPRDVQRKVAQTTLTSPNGGGIQHWSNFNPQLNRALQSASPDTVTTTVPQVPATRTAAGRDQVVRPTPPLEEGQLPDTQVPGLPQEIQRLQEKLPPPDDMQSRQRWDNAVKLVRRDMNMAYANQQHQHRMQQEADKTSDQALTRQYDMKIGTDTSLTSDQILHDPRWKTPEAAHSAVAFFERQTKPDPAAAVSARNTSALFARMTKEWGDPQKINDMAPIRQAFIDQQITEPAYKFLEQQMKDSKTTEGESMLADKKRLFDMYKHSITQSNPLMGKFDDEGDIQFGRFETFVEQQVNKYRAENKNPMTLFNEKSPDYLGFQVQRYQKSLQDSAAGISNKLKANPNYMPPPTSPNDLKRRPGESAIQWEKRTGK